MKNYQQILKEVEQLQQNLMDITDYSEEVYQSLESAIEELEYLAEEEEHGGS